ILDRLPRDRWPDLVTAYMKGWHYYNVLVAFDRRLYPLPCEQSTRVPLPPARPPAPRSALATHRVQLDPVHECVLADRPRMGRASAQGLQVGLAGTPDIGLGDRRERDELDGVDLDRPG